MISVNVNSAASASGLNLGRTNDALQKSLQRLSSGSRIVNSSDDAGGLAVSMKMSAALRRTGATSINLNNAKSFLETQDGAFKVADKVLSRMSELTSLSRDITKNAGDRENYDKEFGNLKTQILSLASEKFNGRNLFNNDFVKGDTISVSTSEEGSQNSSVTLAPITANPMMNMIAEGFKKFGIQGKTFVAERVNSNADIFPDGPTSATTIKNIYTMPGGESHTLSVNSDPITEPTSPTSKAVAAGAVSYQYTFGLNYDLDGVKYTENLPLNYPAANKSVDDPTKPIFDDTVTPAIPKLDVHGYPEFMPLDDKMRPKPDLFSPPVTGSPGNVVGSITQPGDEISYITPNSYTPGQPIGFFVNGDQNNIVYYQTVSETFVSTGGNPVPQQAFEPQKGIPPFIWREVKVTAAPTAGVENPVGEMRWFNTDTGAYTKSLPSGGVSPQRGANPPSPLNFGYGLPFTPPQISSTDSNQETNQGNQWVHRLLSGRINGVGNDNLVNNSTHNTNLIEKNSKDYGDISILAIQQLADMRAQNGAESSRIGFAQDLLKINEINLEAANSRIVDVDISAESTQLARFQILQQAGTAMLAQANVSQQALIKLLQG